MFKLFNEISKCMLSLLITTSFSCRAARDSFPFTPLMVLAKSFEIVRRIIRHTVSFVSNPPTRPRWLIYGKHMLLINYLHVKYELITLLITRVHTKIKILSYITYPHVGTVKFRTQMKIFEEHFQQLYNEGK